MNIIDQMSLIELETKRLGECVRRYYPHRDSCINAGYDTPKNAEQNKTAIKRQIVALRQSLLALEAKLTLEAK